MKKFRLTDKEPKDISSEEIRRLKDFASVSHNYQRVTKKSGKRLYQDPKLFIFIFLILLILFLVFYESEKEGERIESESHPIEFVSPSDDV